MVFYCVWSRAVLRLSIEVVFAAHVACIASGDYLGLEYAVYHAVMLCGFRQELLLLLK